MNEDEALVMDLALEALEYIENNYMSLPKSGSEAITAIKQARSAPVQEPVATLWQHGETGRTRITMPGDITDCDARWFKAADLYNTTHGGRQSEDCLTAAQEDIQRIRALVRAQQITIDKLEQGERMSKRSNNT